MTVLAGKKDGDTENLRTLAWRKRLKEGTVLMQPLFGKGCVETTLKVNAEFTLGQAECDRIRPPREWSREEILARKDEL